MKSFFLIVILSLLSAFTIKIFAQNEIETSVYLEEQIESAATSGDEAVDLSELTEFNTELINNPLNINKATLIELYNTGLFSSRQAESIVHHREKFGKLIAIEELQVTGLDVEFIRSLIPYITVNNSIDNPNARLGRMLSDGKHSIIARVHWVNERKKGFKEFDDTSRYLGSPQSIYIRYRFNFMKKLSVSFIGENDAGEPFFNKYQQSGFDFYAGHIAIRDVSKFRIITLGDYQLQYGQGLSMWSGLSGGTLVNPAFVVKNAGRIKPYTSSNEVYFNRGIATSLRLNKILIDLFYSNRNLDGIKVISSDGSFPEEVLTSIQQSGYHRSINELSSKNNISEQLYGFNASYNVNNFHIGLTSFYSLLSNDFGKEEAPYNLFQNSEKQNQISGIDFKWLYRNINLFGELSLSQHKNHAYLYGVTISADPRLVVSLLYRNYSRYYQNRFGGAFGEKSANTGENGVYGAVAYQISRLLTYDCSYDYYSFPWLKYRTDSPSGGDELKSKLTYRPSRNTELYVRYRWSNKVINSSEDNLKNSFVVPVVRKGWRINVTSKISKSFTIKSRVELSFYKTSTTSESGVVVFQDIRFHPMGFPVSWNVRYALFETDSYESRIYAYENDVLYGYSIPAYYYQGSRIYFNTRIKIRKGLDFWFKYAITFYTNRNEIGSGWEQIDGNKKSEYKIQLVYSSK